MEPGTGTDDFRTRLEQILELEGRKASWLARQIGVSRQRMSDYVGGLHMPEDRAAAVAEALGREVDDVVGPPQPLEGAEAA